MKRFRFLNVILVLALLLAAVPVTIASATGGPVVSEGMDPSATIGGRVRYRNFVYAVNGQAEVMIGKSGFGTYGGLYTTLDFSAWKLGPLANGITFGYDKGSGLLSTTVVANAGGSKSYVVGDLGNLNYVEIYLRCVQAGTSVNFNSVVLAGQSLGSFSCPTGGQKTWMVTGVDLTSGFTLTGDLVMTGPNACAECNKLEIRVGYVAPSDSEGPITSNVTVTPAFLNGPATLTALVDDTTTGGSTIASAEYRLNGGAWTAMSASDGAFDEVAEGVTAGFTAAQIGENTACVRGTDALGNPGAETCQDFLVAYVFAGFFQPIDNLKVNAAKAGQAVPAKWRLTDYLGAPISDPASFVGLYSYRVSCDLLEGDPRDAIEEYASGASGLQYQGDGYWQFNWKTPKSYAGTCRYMFVEFQDGSTSDSVFFQFK